MARPRSLYSPGMQDLPALQRLLVGRQRVLDELINAVKAGAEQHSGPNILLVGPRGAGKTHLLTMARHMIDANAELRPHVLLVWLREEERGVSSYADWLNRLVEAITRHNEPPPPEAPGLDAQSVRRAWLDMDPADVPREAERFLLQFAGRRRLVLLVENLGDLFSSARGLGRDGQARFRDFLQRDLRWTLLATTQGLSDDLAEADAPFYGFFRTIALQPLTQDEAREALKRLAEDDADAETLALLDSPEGRRRARALYFYSGGNPRLVALLYAAVVARDSSGSEGEFSARLVELMDDVTAYYQERLSRLSPLQEKIVTILADAWIPITVGAIARRAFTTPQSISPQLARMLEMHLVRRTADGREAYYELAEPLLRLLFEAKENKGLPSGFIADFLSRWHSLDDLKNAVHPTLARDEATWLHAVYARALTARLAYEPASDTGDTHPPLPAELDSFLETGDVTKAAAWLAEQDLRTAETRAKFGATARAFASAAADRSRRGHTSAAGRGSIDTFLHDLTRTTHGAGEAEAEVACRLARGRCLIDVGSAHESLTELTLGVEVARDLNDQRSLGAFLKEMGHALLDLSRPRSAIEHYEQALAISREIGNRRGEGAAWGNLGTAYADLGEARKAIEHHEQALAISRETGDRRSEGNHLGNLGIAYAGLGEARKAIEHHEQGLAISRETGDRRSEGNHLGNLGIAYADLGEARKAIEHYEQALAISREIDDRAASVHWASLLARRSADTGSTEAARAHLNTALALSPRDMDSPPILARAVARLLLTAGERGDPSGLAAAVRALGQLNGAEAIGIAGSALLGLVGPAISLPLDVLAITRRLAEEAIGGREEWRAPWRLFDAAARSRTAEGKKALLTLTVEERQLVEAVLSGEPESKP